MNSVKIRSAEEEDRNEILDLLNNVFSENQRSQIERGHNLWQWKFKNDLFGKSILTVAEVNNEIVGFDHLWPWELTSRGVIVKAFQPCDSVVASKHRGKGIFKQLRMRGIEEAIKRKHQLLFNFPNKKSLPGNISIGAKHLGRIIWWVKIFEPLKMVVGEFVGGTSSPSDISKEFSLDIEKLNNISNSYKDFHQSFSINRKAGFYEWRYQNRPNRNYGMVSCEEGGKMAGAIFTMNEKGITREMVLVDLIGDPKLSDQLFKKIVEVARSQDATFVAIMGNQKFKTNQLWKRGFIKKRFKNMVVLPVDLSIESKVTNIENWSLVAGLHDSI